MTDSCHLMGAISTRTIRFSSKEEASATWCGPTQLKWSGFYQNDGQLPPGGGHFNQNGPVFIEITAESVLALTPFHPSG